MPIRFPSLLPGRVSSAGGRRAPRARLFVLLGALGFGGLWPGRAEALEPRISLEPAPFDLPPVDEPALTPWLADPDEEVDWILLDSGEWLKGQIVRLRNDELVFVSAALGERTFGWGSIVRLRSIRPLIYILDDRSVHLGHAELKDGVITLTSESGFEKVNKDEVLSILLRKDDELGKWAFRLSSGVTFRTGNTNTVDYSMFSRLTRTDRFTLLRFEYNGAYGYATDPLTGEQNQPYTNKHRGDTALDLFLWPVFYLTPLSSELVYDRLQNIALRWLVAGGAGATAINVSGFRLDTKLATGYLSNHYIESPAGTPSSADGAFVRPGIGWSWAITGGISFEGTWQSAIVVTDLNQTFHRGTARLSFALWSIVRLDISSTYDRQESPGPRGDGSVPGRDDVATSVGLGVDIQ